MNSLMPLIATTPTAPAAPTGPNAMQFMFPALLLAMLAFMLLSARSQKKREKREREDMHSRLAKNDRVLTVGGIIGTVNSVKENEVVLKVDESTNTKMTFLKTSIQRIMADDQDSNAGKR